MWKFEPSSFDLRQYKKSLEWAKQEFDRYAAKAAEALVNGDKVSSILWAEIAASLAWNRHPGFYASRKLESTLLEIGRRINDLESGSLHIAGISFRRQEGGKQNILHVMTEASSWRGRYIGGHPRVTERWIRYASESNIHSVIATSQVGPFPCLLDEAVKTSGGWVMSLVDYSTDLLRRAALLRRIAYEWADVIILHVSPNDAMPLVAFGVEGGPPVTLFNHADHVFWLGVSVTDTVADFHSTGQALSKSRRGVSRSEILPLPSIEPGSGLDREAARRRLGFENRAVVLLTIGNGSKYAPFGAYDFIGSTKEILRQQSEAVLVAIGPTCVGIWKELARSLGSRVRVLGPQEDVRPYYAVADIYLDGFPLGGGMTTLDAGAYGIPVIGLYKEEAPNIGMWDDLSFRGLEAYVPSVRKYVQAVQDLIEDSVMRRSRGEEVASRVRAIHLPPKWNGFSNSVLSSLPSHHGISLPSAREALASPSDLFLGGFQATYAGDYGPAILVASFINYFDVRKRGSVFLEGLRGSGHTRLTSLLYSYANAFAPRITASLRDHVNR